MGIASQSTLAGTSSRTGAPAQGRAAAVQTLSTLAHASAVVFLLWLPVLAVSIVVKTDMLQGLQFSQIADVLLGGHAWKQLSVTSRLSFYRGDLLAALLVPLACSPLVAMAGKYRKWLAALLSASALVLLFVQFTAYQFVGHFLSVSLVSDAVEWGMDHPGDMRAYLQLDALTPPRLAAVAALLAGFGIAAVIARRRWRRLSPAWAVLPRRVLAGWGKRAAGMAGLSAVVLTGVAWLPWCKTTPLHASALGMGISALLDSESGPGEYGRLTTAELRSTYREMAAVPEPAPNAYAGKAAGYDIVLFVLETAPERCLPSSDALADMPNLRRLRQRSWVGSQHYTTNPVSNRAVLSILTSLYPINGGRLFRKADTTLPGLMRSVKSAGYATGVYMPSAISFKQEKAMYHMLGIDRMAISEDGNVSPYVDQDSWQARASHDTDALRMLEEDTVRWHASGRPYAAIFLPQIAHGPWVDVARNGEEKDVLKRGRALLALQDRWLGELMNVLERNGRLDKTLIVVTGDHGIRTALEDPAFHPGRLDDYTFHVPFCLFAPGVLRSTAYVSWPTSHIDITPTLLDLLGIHEGRSSEQGSPIWDARLKDRFTFFLAKEYFGVDGFYHDGEFSMWNRVLDIGYRGSAFHVDGSAVLPAQSAGYNDVAHRISHFSSLELAWYDKVIQ